jgi:hypothetical protein
VKGKDKIIQMPMLCSCDGVEFFPDLMWTSAPAASQLKFFTIWNFTDIIQCPDLSFSIKGEVTLWCTGIGYEQALSMSVGYSF